MNFDSNFQRKRRKGLVRRLRREWRALAPALGLVAAVLAAGTAISSMENGLVPGLAPVQTAGHSQHAPPQTRPTAQISPLLGIAQGTLGMDPALESALSAEMFLASASGLLLTSENGGHAKFVSEGEVPVAGESGTLAGIELK